MGAYRDQDAQEVCAICSTLTTDACLRCATPLCAEHRPAEALRCAACEEEYAPVLARRDQRLSQLNKTRRQRSIVAALQLTIIPIVLFWGHGPMWLIAALLAAYLVSLPAIGFDEAWVRRRERRARRRFLNERKHQPLPGGVADELQQRDSELESE